MEKGRLSIFEKWMHNKNLMKLVSFLLAFMLWFYVAVTQDPTRTDRVENVEIICALNQDQLDQDLRIISKSHDSVDFEATGKRSLVTGVRGNYYATLDLKRITEPGKYNITPDISRPGGVSVDNLNPPVVEIYIDKYVTVALPIKITTVGKPSDEIAIQLSTEPETANVTLLSMDLAQISAVGVVVDYSSIKEASVISCTPVLLNSDDEQITLKNVKLPKTINVDISVNHKKTVKIVPEITGKSKFASEFTATPIPKTVDIYGDPDTISSITSVKTSTITLTKAVSDGQEFETTLSLPHGVSLKSGSEETFKVVFTK